MSLYFEIEANKTIQNRRNYFNEASREYRDAWLNKIREKELNEIEKRAFKSVSDSAGAVIPTDTANEVLKKMKQYAPLLNEITLMNIKGSISFTVEDTINDAEIHTENESINAAEDSLNTITISGYEIVKLIQASNSVMSMSVNDFEAWLTDMLAEKVAEKINYYIIEGTGERSPNGINSISWTTSNSITIPSESNLTAYDVTALIGLLNGKYDRGAKFIMHKKTLFNDFMPLQDNSKNALVTNDSVNNYYIYGYPVLFDDNIGIHEAYLGNLKEAIVGNLPESINVTKQFDIDTNSYKYLGSAMFDSKVKRSDAVVKLIKA